MYVPKLEVDPRTFLLQSNHHPFVVNNEKGALHNKEVVIDIFFFLNALS